MTNAWVQLGKCSCRHQEFEAPRGSDKCVWRRFLAIGISVCTQAYNPCLNPRRRDETPVDNSLSYLIVPFKLMIVNINLWNSTPPHHLGEPLAAAEAFGPGHGDPFRCFSLFFFLGKINTWYLLLPSPVFFTSVLEQLSEFQLLTGMRTSRQDELDMCVKRTGQVWDWLLLKRALTRLAFSFFSVVDSVLRWLHSLTQARRTLSARQPGPR